MAKPKKFGAFAGVFTPSLLTILGVIMYMRLGWVVGNAGLYGAIAIIVVAHIISAATGLSVSSIATDKKIETGGIYYMLSRSLGLPIGGAIGITLFVGTAMSIALYLIGFAESFNAAIGLGNTINDFRITGTFSLAAITMIAFISTSLALRTQFFILLAIGLSLLSIFLGSKEFAPDEVPLLPAADSVPLEVVFAIFFPAVTGFTAGVAMSGDLKDPRKAIPIGTISSIVTGFVVYLILAIFLAFFIDPAMLVSDYNILMKVALYAPLVLAGIWGATLSSALGGILGAPRILQALSIDKVTPGIFSLGKGVENEPRNALIFTFLLAEAGILIGELDVIARVVSMFYLAAYGFINLAAFLESWASSDFRPSFRIPKWVSLVGFSATFIVMFQLDMLAMLASFLIIGAIFFFLARKELAIGSGDVWQSVWTSIVKRGLFKIDQRQMHKRNWEPNILLFSGGTSSRPHLIEFSKALSGRLGMVSSFDLLENEEVEVLFPRQRKKVKVPELDQYGIFSRQQEVRNVYDAIESIASIYGFSGVEPNTILMGWARNSHNPVRFAELTRHLSVLDYNVLYLDYDQEKGYGNKQTIDIWWRGLSNNGELTLSLLKFLISTDDWRTADVRIILVNNTPQNKAMLESGVQNILDRFRVKADIVIINNVIEKLPFYEIIKNVSGSTDLIMLGLPDVAEGSEGKFVERTNELVHIIGTTLLVKASSHFDELSLSTDQAETPEEIDAENMPSITPSQQRHDIRLTLTETPEINSVINQFEHNLDKVFEKYDRKVFDMIRFHSENLSKLVQKSTEDHFTILKNTEDPISDANLHTIHAKIYRQICASLDNFGRSNLNTIVESLEQGADILSAGLEDMYIQCPSLISIKNQDREPSDTQNSWPTGILKSGQIHSGRILRQLIDLEFKKGMPGILKEPVVLVDRIQKILIRELKNKLSDHTFSESNGPDRNGGLSSQAVFLTVQATIESEIDRCRNVLALYFQAFGDVFTSSISDPREFQYKSRTGKLKSQFDSTIQEVVDSYSSSLSLLNRYEQVKVLFSAIIEETYAETLPIVDKVQETCTNILSNNVLRLIELSHSTSKGPLNKSDHENDALLPLNLNRDGLRSGLDELATNLKVSVPSSVELPMFQSSINGFHSEKGVSETVSVPLADYVDYTLKSTLIIPVDRLIHRQLKRLERIDHRIRQDYHLLQINNEPFTEGEKEEQKGIESVINKVSGDIKSLNAELEVTGDHLRTELEKLLDECAGKLNPVLLADPKFDASSLIYDSNPEKSGSKWKKLRYWVDHQLNLFGDHIEKHRTIVASQIFKDEIERNESPILLWNDYVKMKSVSPQVAEGLPLYYLQLFRGRTTHQMDAPFHHQELLEKAFDSMVNRSHLGAHLVLGEQQSGKTFFSNTLASSIAGNSIYKIYSRTGGSTRAIDFIDAMRNATRKKGSIKEILDTCPDNSIFVIDSLELWWERSDRGQNVLNLITDLIKTYAGKHQFIVNCNRLSFNLIRRLSSIEEIVSGKTEILPLDSEAIRSIIQHRHRTGGMFFDYDGEEEEELGYRTQKKLYKTYFRLSNGNPGFALHSWLADISSVNGSKMTLQEFRERKCPEISDSYWLTLIEQFILHKRLNIEKIHRIYGKTEGDPIDLKLAELKSAQIVLSDISGFYYLNPYIMGDLRSIINETIFD